MKKIYYNLFGKHNQKVSFIVLVYFLAAFVVVRSLVYLWTYGVIPEISLVIKGVEIHHFNFGIFILVIVGYLLLTGPSLKNRLRIARLYGIGLALAFDEFGMWLHLENNYWLRQSYDAVIIIAVLLLNIVYLSEIWKKIIEKHIFYAKKVFTVARKKVRIDLNKFGPIAQLARASRWHRGGRGFKSHWVH